MLVALEGHPKPYPWGSRTAIPELFGWSVGSEPLAELWLGAHPAGPATALLDGVALPLDTALGTTPELDCGPEGLPFLLKVLAAEQALSLQVHPDAATAAAGFAAEEAAGVPRDAAHRRYRDPFPKPELVVALGPFRALAGVRAPAETVRVLDAFIDAGATSLIGIAATLREQPTGDGVRGVVQALLTLTPGEVDSLVSQVRDAAAWLVTSDDAAVARFADLVAVLGEHHPGDVGIVASVVLNDLTLDPGEALFQPAGSLHAYVSGLAVELMVSSDNVIRGGLTHKHIDVPELLSIWDPTPAEPVRPPLHGPMASWGPAEGGFVLHRLSPGVGTAYPEVEGAAVVLATEGVVHLEADGVVVDLTPGQAVLAPSAQGIAVSGYGTCFLAARA